MGRLGSGWGRAAVNTSGHLLPHLANLRPKLGLCSFLWLLRLTWRPCSRLTALEGNWLSSLLAHRVILPLYLLAWPHGNLTSLPCRDITDWLLSLLSFITVRERPRGGGGRGHRSRSLQGSSCEIRFAGKTILWGVVFSCVVCHWHDSLNSTVSLICLGLVSILA